jgi:tetratricopeptide (TPR) repeat protein
MPIDEASLGADHPAVARDLNNLAELLSATNRVAEAEPLIRRALAIDEASYGPNHTSVARNLDKLAELLRAMDRCTEAEPLIRRALAIDETAYGPNHPDVARDLNNLAELLRATSRLAEAEPLSRRALEILVAFTRSTGHKHLRLLKAVDIYRQILVQREFSESEIGERLKQIGVEPAWFATA